MSESRIAAPTRPMHEQPEPCFLAIDASTYTGSAAIIRGSGAVAECTVVMRGEKEERLMQAIADMVKRAGLRPSDLRAIVCGAGPGSFTSLRIAASIAKGLAVSLNVPLLAIPSWLLVLAGADPPLPAGTYVVFFDAMRGESYAALGQVTDSGAVASRGGPSLVRTAEAAEYAARIGGAPLGPAMSDASLPHARGVARFQPIGLKSSEVYQVDVDTWEPSYGRMAEAQVKWEAAHGRPLPGR